MRVPYTSSPTTIDCYFIMSTRSVRLLLTVSMQLLYDLGWTWTTTKHHTRAYINYNTKFPVSHGGKGTLSPSEYIEPIVGYRINGFDISKHRAFDASYTAISASSSEFFRFSMPILHYSVDVSSMRIASISLFVRHRTEHELSVDIQ